MDGEKFNWKGRLGPMELLVSGATFTPSTITTIMAKDLTINSGESVIDVGCGSGILSIIAAKLGAGSVIGIDQSPDVVDVGNYNAEKLGVADRIRFYQGDLFSPIPEDLKVDVIIGDVSGIPDTLASYTGWFPSGKGGGTRGCELPIRMLTDAAAHLKSGGRIYLPTGTLQDENKILEAARSMYRNVDMLAERKIPFPNEFAESDVARELIESGTISIASRGTRYLWIGRAWLISEPY
jgi:precorrin-6B methylase 2